MMVGVVVVVLLLLVYQQLLNHGGNGFDGLMAIPKCS